MFSIKPLLTAGALAALVGSAPAGAQAGPDGDDAIVVRNRLEQTQRHVEVLSKAISRRPRVDKPLSKWYAPMCVGVYGLAADKARQLIGRIEANAAAFGIRAAGEGCLVNTLVAFTKDSRSEIGRLKKSAPWLFETLLDYEYDRILRGTGAAQAWHSTRVKDVDGMEFGTLSLGKGIPDVLMSTPFKASHFDQQLRVDIEASMVVFDNAFVSGKTIQQLADYATVRLLASTHDIGNPGGGEIDTILTLFAEGASPPEGLTSFDRAYLGALYRLPPNARGSALHEATWSAFRRGYYDAADQPAN